MWPLLSWAGFLNGEKTAFKQVKHQRCVIRNPANEQGTVSPTVTANIPLICYFSSTKYLVLSLSLSFSLSLFLSLSLYIYMYVYMKFSHSYRSVVVSHSFNLYFPMTNDVKHLFMCYLPSIFPPHLSVCSNILPHLKIGLFWWILRF